MEDRLDNIFVDLFIWFFLDVFFFSHSTFNYRKNTKTFSQSFLNACKFSRYIENDVYSYKILNKKVQKSNTVKNVRSCYRIP